MLTSKMPLMLLSGCLAAWGAAAPANGSGSPAPSATFTDFSYEGQPMPGAPARAGPGHYLNPILAGSASDPAITRVGKDYYLATSSFTYWPGLPIYRSRDLVHWTRIGAALTRADQMPIRKLDTWQGIYAPGLSWHEGRFYLVGTCYGCGGNFIMTAARAEGPWSDPTWLPFEGIDPSLFFDKDGRAYIVHNGPPPGEPRWDGHRAIWLQQIDLATLKPIGAQSLLVDGGGGAASKPFWIEGPHLIRHDGHYILICALGGTKEHHREVAFRADSLRGPFVMRPVPILPEQAPHAAVVQAGHADLVSTPTGQWWSVFLAARPSGPGQLDYTTGRETFLLPVSWQDGWPVILAEGQAVSQQPAAPGLIASPGGAPGTGGHRFAPDWHGRALDGRWLTLGSVDAPWWRMGGGSLRIQAQGADLGGEDQPALMAIRQTDPQAAVRVTVRFDPAMGGGAGLSAFADAEHFWALLVTRGTAGGREMRLIRRDGAAAPREGRVVARAPLPGAATGPVRLKMSFSDTGLTFAYATGRGGWTVLGGGQDALSLAVSRTNGFTGTVLGAVVLGHVPG